MTPLEKPKNLSSKITPLASSVSPFTRRGSWRIASDLPASFRYAADGFVYSLMSQRNFRIHLFMGALV